MRYTPSLWFGLQNGARSPEAARCLVEFKSELRIGSRGIGGHGDLRRRIAGYRSILVIGQYPIAFEDRCDVFGGVVAQVEPS